MDIYSEGVKVRPGSETRAKPRSGAIGEWVTERSSLNVAVKHFLDYPVPQYVYHNILYSLGGLTAISIMLQFVSGVLLLFYYVPSPQIAYDSVDFVTYQLPLGWLIRGWHYYNASALVILMFLHMLHTFFSSAYKKPREVTWLSGVVLLLLTMGVAFTGGLLRWDQTGFWATRVGVNIAGSIPLIGPAISSFIRGGADIGQITLTRFFVVHVGLLPVTLGLIIVFHLYHMRKHGISPAVTERERSHSRKFVPFYPHWVAKDALIGLGLLAVLTALSIARRAPLEFAADPSSTDFIPRPEWYFLSLFQLLKYMPGPLEPVATVLVPGLLVGALILLPFIDRGEERRPWRKPLTSGIAIVVLIALVTLTVLAQ